ncbi:hypothetical protein TNCV_510911 [Trichonephila clavipes]|nr:hypothetical protein TNCV_510911 [Trichonephila clavipes]
MLRLGGYMAVIQFNKGFQGLIDTLKHFGVTVGVLTLKGFSELDEIRKTDSKRHSLTVVKVAIKNRVAKKKKIIKNELIEGVTYLLALNLNKMMQTPELEPPELPHQVKGRIWSLDRLNVHYPMYTASLQWHNVSEETLPATSYRS